MGIIQDKAMPLFYVDKENSSLLHFKKIDGSMDFVIISELRYDNNVVFKDSGKILKISFLDDNRLFIIKERSKWELDISKEDITLKILEMNFI